ncbi:VCBS domain-containing protein [Shimia sp. R9_3]|uniref:VCBS domain-containing protein n=1 Tax=Shimia sp. R9_3 TaxID=2821113 RepID=UPI001ADB6B73|nr:VCBS domain-containing protein [Shimia sp. R9_3]MBO9401805.1 VCBS domain-containing protein [Shimia sp. R9_3]
MSDLPSKDDPKAQKPSLREGLSEEGFGWVVFDPIDMGPETERSSQGGEADPALPSGRTDGRSFQIPISAINELSGQDPEDLPMQGAARAVVPPVAPTQVSDLLNVLPGAQHMPGAEGQLGTLRIPLASLGDSVGHTVEIAPQMRGEPTGGQVPTQAQSTQLAFAGHPNGPAVVAMTATGFEDRPLKLMVSAVDGGAHSNSVTTHFHGLPPGATLSAGHPDPTGGWVVPAGTPLTGIQLIPAANWFGSGAIGITVTQPDGQTATALLPFNIVNTPDAAVVSGLSKGAATEDLQQTASGKLSVSDPDPGEAAFAPTSEHGKLGTLEIESSGAWKYTLDNSKTEVQALLAKDRVTETFVVRTIDGTSCPITITVAGTDDRAVISGTAVGAVTEDKTQSTGGKLDVTDPDAGQAGFVPQTGVQGAHGSFTVAPDGTWSYTLDNSQPAVQGLKSGEQITDRLTVSTIDGTTREIVVTINGTDDRAVISGTGGGAVTEDHNVSSGQLVVNGALLIIDPDKGDDHFVSTPQTDSLGGTFGIGPSGAWTYAIDNGAPDVQRLGAGQSITTAFTVTSADGTTHQIHITIRGTNDAPVLSAATASATEDGAAVTGQMSATDLDAGDSLTYALGQAAPAGFTLNADGSWHFDPTDAAYQHLAAGQSEQIIIPVTVTDGSAIDTQNLVITVKGTNDAATFGGVSTGGVTEDKSATASGSLSVTDPDTGESQIVAQSRIGGFGAFTISADGSWTYQLDNAAPSVQGLKAGETVTDRFWVNSLDGSAHHAVEITVHGTNDAPVLAAASASATEDGHSITGQMNATDVDVGDNMRFSMAQPVAGFVMDRNGAWHFDPTDATYQHLAVGATEQITIPVIVTDGTATDTQSLVITVTGTNDGPAVSGPVALPGGTEDKAVLISAAQLLEHATDVDTGDHLSVTSLTVSHGSITGDAAHGFTFTPPANYNGPVSLSYTVTDGHGGSVAQTASLNLAAVGDAAVIGGVDTGDVTEDKAGVDKSPDQHQPGIGVIGTETLNASGKLTIIDPDQSEAVFDTHGLGYTYHGTYGDLNLRANGEWFYSADAGNARFFDGRPTTRGTAIDQLGEGQTLTDTITVYSKDGTAHDITITIHGSNDAPYCESKVTLAPGTEDTAQTLTKAQLLANTVEVDANDTGKLSIAGLRADHGSIRDNGDGTYTFTPARDYNGAVHFTYDVKDAHGGVNHTGATTTLAAVSDAAIIGGTDRGSATEDHVKGRIVVSGLLTVSDPDGPSQEHFQYSQFGEHAISDPFGGNLHIDSSGSWSYVTDNSNAAVQQLAAGQEGHATYRVRSADGTTHQIHITIRGTNDAPVLSAATASATEDGAAVAGQMSATDVDSGDTLTYSLGQAAPAGFTLNADGSWHFDPTDAAYQHLGAGATEQITIPVTVADGTATDTKSLAITVTGTNDGPAVTGPVMLPGGTEDKSVPITVAQLLAHATDVDTGDQLTITGLSASHGTIAGDAANGFTFTPDANYNGPVSLSYTVNDGQGGAVAQTASLTLAGDGDPAIITDVKIPSVTEDRGYINTHYELQVYGKLDITDPDPGEASFDPNIGSQTYQGIGYNSRLGGHILLQRDGNFIYYIDNRLQVIQQLGAGQTATDTTTIRSLDGTTHEIQITIHGTNDVPVLSTATASATEDGSSVTGQMSATDVDSGDTLAYSLGQAAPAGFTLNADGSWHFDPTDAAYQHLAAGATEQVTIPVTVTDGTATDTQNLVITVTGTNDGAVYTGATSGSVTEDKISFSGKLETPWHNVDITDPDTGEGQVVAIEVGGVLHQLPANFASTIKGTYGAFHTTHGTDGHDKWMYFADNGNPTIQGLKAGENLGETAVLVTQDGTRVPISVTIQGHEDGVVIATPPSSAGWLGEVVEDKKAQVSGQLQAHDIDVHDSVSFTPQTTTNTYGTFTVDASGHWAFALNNSAVQSMRAGQRHAMGFDVEAVSSDGSKATQHIEIFARGTNDAPVLSASTASATEGGQRVTGQMSATDVDTGDTLHFSITQPVDGFSISGDGSWRFDPTNAAYQTIPNGQTRDVTITVTVTDKAGATDTRNLVITVTGTNGSARIAGVDTGNVTEDVGLGHHTTLAAISTSGTLTITDPDPGEAEFIPLSGAAGAGRYGSLLLDAQGHWTYTADNTQTAIQQLTQRSAPLTDTFTVTSKDGTHHTVTLSIHGTNDAPIAVSQQGAVTEGALQSGHLSVLDVDAGDTHQFTTTATVPGFVLNTDGSYTFDASVADYQGLKAGEVRTIDVPVTITDRGGLTDSFTFHWAVTGTNDAPRLTVSVPQLSTPEDTPITIRLSDLHYSDPDGDALDHLTILDVPYASQGVLKLNGVQVAAHTQISAADLKAGHLVFQPATDVHRTDTYFRFTTHDGHTESNPARAHINITPVNDAPTVSARDLGQTDAGQDKTFTSAQLLSLVQAQDVDHDSLSVSSVRIDRQFGTFTHDTSADTWTFHPASGVHRADIPVSIGVTDGMATTQASAQIDVVQTYTPPDLAVSVDVRHATQIPGSGSQTAGGGHGSGGYNAHLDQMMHQLQHDHGGRVVSHVHDEVKGSEHNDRVFIFANMGGEEINMEKGSDFFYLRGTTHEKIEGKENTDTLVLGSYDSSRHGPHSWRHIPEIKDVENIMTNDGVWVRGGPPHGFDSRYFQAAPPPHYAYDLDVRITNHGAGGSIVGIRISHLAAGLSLQDHLGQAVPQNRDGSYTIDPAHSDVTLISDHHLSQQPSFQTEVTTQNAAVGIQTVSTQHPNGHVDHVDSPMLSHDEPMSPVMESVFVVFEDDQDTFAAAQDQSDVSLPDAVDPYLASVGLQNTPTGPDHPENLGSDPYLVAVGIDGTALPTPELTAVDPDVLESGAVDQLDDVLGHDEPDPLQDIPDVFDTEADTGADPDDTQNG